MTTAPSAPPRVAVLGAGIAGLTAAYTLQQQGVDVTVFEATSRPGGVIRSEVIDGYLVEHGPNTLQSGTPVLASCLADLGLEAARCPASEAARKRFVVRGGSPLPLPTSPLALLSTPLFSARARWRLLREPFVPPAPPHLEESVADFTRRRLGEEWLAYAVNPFVAGIYAGDPERLSLPHAFPTLHELEQTHGSLIGGLFRRMRARRAAEGTDASPRTSRRPFSFRDGLAMLPEALARRLGPAVQYGQAVTRLVPTEGGVLVETGDASPRPFDAALVALPLYQLTGLLDVDEAVGPQPAPVTYPPVSVVALGFRREDVAHPLDGFGVLVPACETDFQILGTLFSSTLFPGRAPDGHVLLTTLLGGARRPELALAPEARREQAVLDDLRRLLGIRGRPTLVRHVCWPRAIPQYERGYGAVKAWLAALERHTPRLAFAGNYRAGVSVGDTMASGVDAAHRLARTLGVGTPDPR